MIRLLIAALLTLTLTVQAQDVSTAKLTPRSGLTERLNFEGQQPNEVSPTEWDGGPGPTLFADNKIVHSGHWSARIERNPDSLGDFSSLHKAIAVDFGGKTIELRGFLRTEDVTEFAGLWVREDGAVRALAFDNMQNRHLKGTTDWTEYSIQLPIDPEATRIFFGVVFRGTGKVWADDLQLLVDGKPIADAPKAETPKTVLDSDQQFNGGSGLVLTELTKVQIDNLAVLGKVWGFLKYHHPQITSGQRHWDYELLRVLPTILKAQDRATANAAMVKWITPLGDVAACKPCSELKESDLHLRPNVQWITDEKVLGKDLSQKLRWIDDNRSSADKQFYVSLAPGVGNPVFQHELNYENLKLPDPGFQILALYRFWNIIQYWFPYRDVLGQDWDKVLAEFIPRISLAKSADDYKRELFALIARVHDTHANLWSSLKTRPPLGDCRIPVNLRFIENHAVVTGYSGAEAAKDTGLNIGDVITEMDNVPVTKFIAELTPYYAASNDAARMRDITRYMTRGSCGEAGVHVLRDNQDIAIKTKRVTGEDNTPRWHDLPGNTFRLLSKDVAYLKLSSVKAADAKSYVESAAGTKGLIIDIRNYPSEFMVFALGSLLVDKDTPFARFTAGDPATPSAFHWTESISLQPKQPHYAGKLVVLVDEVSLSQAEYTTMAFRAAGAIVVGSTTSGADGNVSPIPLPGGLRSLISGIGVFYPDKKPTQRVGIVPDVVVRPTIAGIRAGRDEVLEEAVRQILGDEVSIQQILKMYQGQ